MAKKRYADVVEMMGDLTEDPDFADDLGSYLARRVLSSRSCGPAWHARGLTQKDVAELIKISKVESSSDGDLSLSTVVAYADAMVFALRSP